MRRVIRVATLAGVLRADETIPGLRFDEPGMTFHQIGQVMRIGDVSLRCGRDEVGVAAQHGEPVGQTLHLGNPGEHVEHACEDVHRAGGVLADEEEHRVAQPGVVGYGLDEHDAAIARDRTGG